LFRDGFLILNTILALFRDYRPLTFFGVADYFWWCSRFFGGVLCWNSPSTAPSRGQYWQSQR
jgi:hypothetical protein